MRKTKLKIFLLLTSIAALSCGKEEPVIVPDVYVNFSINLLLPQYNSLTAPNNAILISAQGYNRNGVIIYHFDQNDYRAFDATCPQHIDEITSITLDDNGSGGFGTCPHCQTSYSFFNYGQASKGYPLKRYNASLEGSYLHIFN